jgi:Fe-S cluster assembly protein SufD
MDLERLAASGRDPKWLHGLRSAALTCFEERGFPGSGDEDWRFTNVSPIAQARFRPAARGRRVDPEGFSSSRIQAPGWTELVFVDGRLTPWSHLTAMPKGVKLGSLRRALEVDGDTVARFLAREAGVSRNAFTALNTALFEDGACLYVPAGVELTGPIHLLFVSGPGAGGEVTHPRNLILLGAGARASIVETYVSTEASAHWTNPVTEILLGEGSALEYVRVEDESEKAFHLGTTAVRQGRDSRFTSFSVTMGGAIARHNLDVVMDGTGVETHLSGFYMGRGDQLLDHHTSVRHAHPDGASRELYKGILDDRAHGVFNGKVYVTPEAQKTDGKQTNRNLLLSDQARVDTKPQLEIFADDVKCTHGATVGRLDEGGLFYLKSRGIGAGLARKILTYAFAAEVLEEIPHKVLRQRLEAAVMGRLDQRQG